MIRQIRSHVPVSSDPPVDVELLIDLAGNILTDTSGNLLVAHD
jgi:hypothetical protein